MKAKKKGGFPDLNKDGKITRADILKGRGVFKKGGKVDVLLKGLEASSSSSKSTPMFNEPERKDTGKRKPGAKSVPQGKKKKQPSILGYAKGGKVRAIKKKSKINFDTGAAFEAKSKSRSAADKMYASKASGSGLKSKLSQDSEGNYIRRSVDSSPAFSKGGKVKDACYSKVKSRYRVWPSAYASGALAKCRKVGAKNWGNKSKK